MGHVWPTTHRFADNRRACMKNPYCRAEAAHQSPIPFAIFFESLLSFFDQSKDLIWRAQVLNIFGEGIAREVDLG